MRIALAILLFPATLLAEIAVEPSIEWMVADADLVVRARFREREAVEGDWKGYSVSRYRVDEALLGQSNEQLEILARDMEREDAGVEKAEYLLFVRRHAMRFREAKQNAVADRVPYTLSGWFRLDAPIEVHTISGEVVEKRAELLDRVRRAAAFTRKAVARAQPYHLEVPSVADSFWKLYGGSAVFLVVPVDTRLARLARAWSKSDDEESRRAAKAALRICAARARAFERIAGKRGDGRLEEAEAAIAELRGRLRRRLDACEGDLQRALIRARLAQLSPGPDDREANAEILRLDFDEVVAAAKATLWPIVLCEGSDAIGPWIELCERIEGRVACNVLRVSARKSGRLHSFGITEERLYCFRHDGRAHFVGLYAYWRAGETVQHRVDASKVRGSRDAVPPGMELPQPKLSAEQLRQWHDSSPFGWWGHVPKWVVPYLVDEFRGALFPLGADR